MVKNPKPLFHLIISVHRDSLSLLILGSVEAKFANARALGRPDDCVEDPQA